MVSNATTSSSSSSSAAVKTNYTIKLKPLWHSSQVYCLCFDRSSRFVFTGGDDGRVKVYCCQTDRLVRCLTDNSNSSGGNDDEYADEVDVLCRTIDWETDTNIEAKFETELARFAICDLAVNYENTLVAAAKHTGSVSVWSLKTFDLIAKLDEQVYPIRSIHFSPVSMVVNNDQNKKYLISTSEDGFIYFYAYDDKSLKFTAKAVHRKTRYDNERAVNVCCDYSTGGLLLAVIHTAGHNSDEPVRPSSKLTNLLAKKSVQSVIRVFSLTDEQFGAKEEWKCSQHKTHLDCVYSLRFCHNSFRFACTCDQDTNAYVWSFDKANKKWDSIILDINAKQNKKSLRGSPKHQLTEELTFVDELTFSCDDRYLLTDLTDCSIKVYDSESGELVRHFNTQHTNKISIIECHPIVGHMFLTASYDSNIFIYDILQGVVVNRFDCCLVSNRLDGNTVLTNGQLTEIRPLILQCSFSADGQTIAAADNLGNVTVFTADRQKRIISSLDRLEAELRRIHSDSSDIYCDNNYSDVVLTTDDITICRQNDSNFLRSLFDFELDLLHGIEKPSPNKTNVQQNSDHRKAVKHKPQDSSSSVVVGVKRSLKFYNNNNNTTKTPKTDSSKMMTNNLSPKRLKTLHHKNSPKVQKNNNNTNNNNNTKRFTKQ
ncbi:bromodomain and WD repeat-containing protein 1-like [Oppia nitens]|uniref:bromodomain and WD repeat-containing protein 1-like n=1 Tax=Oppia nitens TaxID=1686743 RepID=UPI0023DC804C|nr:bromodomain and WD repeat-containing protein 1-like [Oppia nitens]